MRLQSLLQKLLFVFFLYACSPAKEKINPVKHTIEIKEMRFQPAELLLHAGDTVEWINHDLVDHDVTEEKDKSWSSGILINNKSWQRVINSSTNYFCSIHIVMKGRLIVSEK